MRRLFNRSLAFHVVLVMILVVGACKKPKEDASTNNGPPSGGPMGRGPMGGGASTPIKEIMVKIAKPPQSLTSLIGKELETEPLAWDTIQAQTKEFVQLAGSLAKYDPPKGTKESWTKLTADYNNSVVALEKAAQAKNKDKAMAAHKILAES